MSKVYEDEQYPVYSVGDRSLHTPEFLREYDAVMTLWSFMQDRLEEMYIIERDQPDLFDDSMDGDHASALASAGFGTDEDYGGGDERL
jgi:hypothetical protein